MSITQKNTNSVTFFASDILTVPHGFTTRLGGVSTGIFDSLNLGFHRGDSQDNILENYRRLGVAIGFSLENAVLTWQIHSDIVRTVTKKDHHGLDHRAYPQCDALITCDPGTALVIFNADCTPILFHDPVTGAVGAAHAGWRGTASAIARKTVEAMVREFGCDPKNIRSAIGPNLDKCCFETDEDVPQAMLSALGEEARPFIRRAGDKFFVDLKGINALWLQKAGVSHIEISGECTMCHPDRFFSHRVTKGMRGSQGAIIVCKEENR